MGREIVFRRQADVKEPGKLGDPVASPGATQRDGEREHTRPTPRRHTMQIAYEFREERVRVQLLDDDRQERPRPAKLRSGCCKATQFTRTPFVSPSLGIELLFGPDGFFEQIVAVDDRRTDLTHAAPPRISGTHA
jgi:hypothetical protein